MLIGVISDVHDNLRHLQKAIKVFKEQNIGLLIHCGDWVMPFTLESYLELSCPIKGVMGNGDPDIQKFLYQIQNKFKSLDIELSERFLDLNIDGKRIGVFHGNDEALKKVLIESQLFEILCLGHSHEPLVKKEGETLVVNPGSLVGVMLPDKPAAPVTVALINTTNNSAEIIDLDI